MRSTRPGGARRLTRSRLAAPSRTGRRSPGDEVTPHRPSAIEWLGRLAGGLVHWSGLAETFGSASVDEPPDVHRIRGWVVVVAAMVALVSPPVGLGLACVGWHVPRHVASRARSRRAAEIDRHLLLAVELLAVAARGGVTVPVAIGVVAVRVPGRVGASLRQVGSRTDLAMRFDEALVMLGDELGPASTALVAVLRAAHLDGDPLAPALHRLGDAMRVDQRQRVEAGARRLSVQLVVPLVCCILPAFALISVVPMLVESLHGLPR